MICDSCSKEFDKITQIKCNHALCEDCWNKITTLCPICKIPYKMKDTDIIKTDKNGVQWVLQKSEVSENAIPMHENPMYENSSKCYCNIL